MADVVPVHEWPPPSIRSEVLDDGTLVVWDEDDRESTWIHGRPVQVRE